LNRIAANSDDTKGYNYSQFRQQQRQAHEKENDARVRLTYASMFGGTDCPNAPLKEYSNCNPQQARTSFDEGRTMMQFCVPSTRLAAILLFSAAFRLTGSCAVVAADQQSDVSVSSAEDARSRSDTGAANSPTLTRRASIQTVTNEPADRNVLLACPGDLVIVHRHKPLYGLCQGRFVESGQLKARTWLRTTGDPVVLQNCDIECGIQQFFPVRVVPGCPTEEGWITLDGTVNVTRLKATLAAQQSAFPLSENPNDGISALMLRQPEDLQRAWQEAQQAINENLLIPEAEQSPAPWLARGEIQALAGNYHGALSDYVVAARIVQKKRGDPQSHASAFRSLSTVLQGLATAPVPPVVIGHLEEWERGYYAWRRGDFVIAAQAFQNATELSPHEPVYWYFRAITHREIGLPDRALHDARIGAWLEHQQASGHSFSHHSAAVSRRLEPVQGPVRHWLELQRRGYQRRVSSLSR